MIWDDKQYIIKVMMRGIAWFPEEALAALTSPRAETAC